MAACGLSLLQRQLYPDTKIVKRQTASQQSSMHMQLRLPLALLEKCVRASIRTALCLCSCHGDWNQPPESSTQGHWVQELSQRPSASIQRLLVHCAQCSTQCCRRI